MEKIKAFLTALILFLCIAAGVHFYTEKRVENKDTGMGTWTDEAKYASAKTMQKSMDENTLLVMGSSELQHQKKTPYNPANLFAGQDMNLMMVGAGYYQSLYHATLLSAMEEELQNRKAVLILAPQWFRKSGVRPEAYASRFSEENFLEMLGNQKISSDLKEYIVKRTKKLLSVDPATKERVKQYEARYLKGEKDLWADFKSDCYQAFLREKNRSNIALRLLAHDLFSRTPEELLGGEGEPSFPSLREQAAEDGKAAWGGNPFYVSKKYYENHIVKVMDEVENEGINTGYSVSPEFEDFECFLKVCREAEITPLIVIAPVNGYWYDFIGFPADAREDYYSQVRALCEKYGAETADFSDREYEEFFMEDTVHIGWKGWVDVCEAMYRYAEDE